MQTSTQKVVPAAHCVEEPLVEVLLEGCEQVVPMEDHRGTM